MLLLITLLATIFGWRAAVEQAHRDLQGHGRVLVRPSGTEPALRIMVEGDDDQQVLRIADQLEALARERLN